VIYGASKQEIAAVGEGGLTTGCNERCETKPTGPSIPEVGLSRAIQTDFALLGSLG
jgi:hypothetical protein